MAISEDKVREELKQVVDPELFVNIVDLGLVYAVGLKEAEEDKTNVEIEMTLTSPACPAGPQLIGQSQAVLGQLEGVGEAVLVNALLPSVILKRVGSSGSSSAFTSSQPSKNR